MDATIKSQSTTALAIKAALLAALVVALSASVVSADPPGNNGTVKVHSGTGEVEPPVDNMNQPHVTCPFHMHFFFGDAGQEGMWWVTSKDGVAMTGGTYTADANGTAHSGAVVMAAGHYTLSWQGSTEELAKHKTFWVEGECSGGPGG
jgi:hypothetical protein